MLSNAKLARKTAHLTTRMAATASIALLLTTSGLSAAPARLDDLLGRSGEYVRHFEQEFAKVLLDELYDQYRQSRQYRQHVVHRQLRSEMLFVRVRGQGLSWLTARNVVQVDGATVPDSADRLERAIKGTASGLGDRLRSVADESARFNLGEIRRNFNDPNLALLFLDPEHQRRFSFRLEEEKLIDTARARRISFKESAQPTVIRDADGKDIQASGSFVVLVDNGIVVRTELSTHRIVDASIAVDYRRDPKLDMWIPSRMSEHYFQPSTRESVDCTATYSNARRFETSGRLIVK